MRRSPFPSTPPAATAGNGFSPQANQQFPSGSQQPFPQTTFLQSTAPRPGGAPFFQPLVPPASLRSLFQSSVNNPQGFPGTSQVPDRSSLMQQPPPRGHPSLVPQSLPFNNPSWQMRKPSPSLPPPGLTLQPFTFSTEPAPGVMLSPSQRSFVSSTVPIPVILPRRQLAPSPVPFPGGLDKPLQRPFLPTATCMSPPVRTVPVPQRHSISSPVPIPVRTITPTPRPFTSFGSRAATIPKRPLTSLFATSTLPSPVRITAPPQGMFALSNVPSTSERVRAPTQRPFVSPTMPSTVYVTSPAQRPLAPSTVPSPGRAIAPSQTMIAPSTLPYPARGTSPMQRLYTPSAFSPPGGFPTPSQQKFVTPIVPSPRNVLSPPRQPVPRGVPPQQQQPTSFNSPPNGRFQPVPQQPFVPSTVPASRRIAIPGQQPSPVINQSWPAQTSQLSSPSLFQGPTLIPSSLPSLSGIPSSLQQFSPPSNSPLHTASSLPSSIGLNHGPSIAAALDRHIIEKQFRGMIKVVVSGQGTNMHPSCAPQQISSTSQTAVWRSPSLSNTKEVAKGREHRSRRHYSPGSHGSRPQVLHCFSPPPPAVERVVKCVVAEEYYIKKKDDQMESCYVEGTDNLSELHNRFQKEILNMESLERVDDDNEIINSGRGHHSDQYDSVIESLGESDVSGNPVKSRLRLFPSDDEENSDEDTSDDESHALSNSSSESDNDEGGELSDDDDDDDEEEEDSHNNKGPSVAEIRKRKIEDPQRLHPELWFNEAGETNDGLVCRCSSSDKCQGIRHGVYPGETVITSCDPLTNNADKLHHYWVTVTPHTNFMTSNPSIIHAEGKDYTFEGFSMFCHHPLEQVPLCSVIRFNIEYTLHVVSQPVPENFCIKDLDLFSEFLFYKVLELADWNFTGNIQDSCRRYHFMPRFVHRSADTDNSTACHELLSMSQVLSHVLKSAEPLIKPSHFELSTENWEEYIKTCKNAIVMNPDKKPAALRVDNLQFCKAAEGSSKGKVYPYIVHHSIRPVQMSFAGDPKYQKLLKTHHKLRSLISNT